MLAEAESDSLKVGDNDANSTSTSKDLVIDISDFLPKLESNSYLI